MKIAACIDGQGEPLSPQEPCILRLFAHEDGAWRHVSDTAFNGITARSIAEITQQAERLGALLDGAEALLVRDVKGIAVTLLQNLGLRLWRLDGPPEAALDAVRRELEAAARELPDPARFFASGETEGEYRIDLAAVLASDSSLNSQLVLVPFMQQTPFSRLEVVCDHPPRWLDRQLPAAGFDWEDASQEGVCRLIIRPSGESTGMPPRGGGCGNHGAWPTGGGCSGGGCA
ncbi:Fe-only nitrogenase accessory protein AnfO [Thiobaca trueperi]|uniref:Fe-only nitrogenase accessory protein AnfO n=1 Tax=Thiobaca trueperi TaxID=127458 RepID=A0A4R3N6B9_9GAMM|nr:Fe-only nitrogenase accessory protein AnfO [Thiobaca trueperi]TCT24027.1 Fe-only nitrogenase accessory protein AnfO [Thiobaca trueperi]